jgi:co-chaperonin GroES (HSP10)
MKIRPLFARVLIERELKEAKGILLLPTTQKRLASHVGKVLAVGPNADPSILVGARVLLGKYSGTWVDEDGTPMPDGYEEENTKARFFICQDEDILAVLSDE